MSIDKHDEQAPRHRTAEEIVTDVLKEPMSDEVLGNYIVHTMMFCVTCGKVRAIVTELNEQRRWTREELVHHAETLLKGLLPPQQT